MIKQSDLYQAYIDKDLDSNGIVVARTNITYDVRRYDDLRNLKTARQYVVKCTQRIQVPNASGYTFAPGQVTQFNGYPAQLSTQIAYDASKSVVDGVDISGFSPKTLNASISTSASASDSSAASKTNSREHSSGSSTADTNSYGASANIGFFGDQLTGGLSGNYEHSTTKTKSHSNSTGHSNTTDHGHSTSGSTSMSIKDWGSYAIEDPEKSSVEWIWGQEFPWNVIQLKNTKTVTGDHITLPDYVINRLWNGDGKDPIVYPPSELSLFGISFVSSVAYLVTAKDKNADFDTLALNHSTKLCNASHGLDSNKAFYAELDVINPGISALPSPALHLDLLALDPIAGLGGGNGAETGFIAKDFVVPPASGAAFKINSDANNLLVQGSGFESVMAANFAKGDAKLTVYFKVIDSTLDYTLTMKHYKTADTDCLVNIVINSDTSNTISKTLAATAGDGGDGNFTRIRLRNKDLMFDEYYDYLSLGLNKIEITIAPADGKTGAKATAGYVLKGLAID